MYGFNNDVFLNVQMCSLEKFANFSEESAVHCFKSPSNIYRTKINIPEYSFHSHGWEILQPHNLWMG